MAKAAAVDCDTVTGGSVMLKRLQLHNFHCFVELDLELSERCLLVGSNGSGKTSLWEVMASLQDVIVRGAEVGSVFPTRSLTRWLSGEPVQKVGFELESGGEAYRYELEIAHDVERRLASIRREQLLVGGLPIYEAVDGEVRLFGDVPTAAPRTRFPFGRKRSFLPELESRGDDRRTLAFREAVANIWLLAPSPRRLEATTAGEAPWLERDGRNFSSWFRGILLERQGILQSLVDALKPTMPGLQRIAFERVSSEVRELMATFAFGGVEYKLSASELSNGQRSLLLLHGFLLGALSRPGVVFLDEPEIGLAPHEMQPWLAAMSAALDQQGGQALVISHHPAVVDYLAPVRTIRFSRPGGGPARTGEVTVETTGGTTVSEWLSRPWAYEDEHEERAGTVVNRGAQHQKLGPERRRAAPKAPPRPQA